MRGSCSGSPREGDLSLAAQAVAKVERLEPAGTGVREVREPSIHAVELLAARPLVRALDREPAVCQRLAGELERPEALRLLGLLEERDVDLGGEHLVRAAHVAGPAQRVVVRVQRGALLLRACRGSDHAVAVRQALAALGGLGTTNGPAHRREFTRRE